MDIFSQAFQVMTGETAGQMVRDPWFWNMTIILIWSIVWKGIALWKSAKLSHKKWFIVFLIVNTFGILEVIYIRFVARKYTVETIVE